MFPYLSIRSEVSSILVIFLLCAPLLLSASIKGGEIHYEHLSGFNYEFTVTLYTNSGAVDNRCHVVLYSGTSTTDTLFRVNGPPTSSCAAGGEYLNPSARKSIYVGTLSFPGSGTHLVKLEESSRSTGILNIPSLGPDNFYLESEVVINTSVGANNSTYFAASPIFSAAANTVPLTHNVTAIDPDGDSLSYSFIDCQGTGGIPFSGYTLPSGIQLNAKSGEIIWPSPSVDGSFSVAVKISEWRNGALIGSTQKDFTVDWLTGNPVPDLDTLSGGWTQNADGDYEKHVYPGDTIRLISKYQPAGGLPSLNGYGEPMVLTSNPAQLTILTAVPGLDRLGRVEWTPTANEARLHPYVIVYRATFEYPASGRQLHKDLTMMIYVDDPNLVSTPKEQLKQLSFTVYPNPVFNKVWVELPSRFHHSQIEVWNSLGMRVIAPKTFTMSKYSLDINHLSSGTYFLRISTEGQEQWKPIEVRNQ